MFSLFKSKRVANIVVNDYAIRIIETNGPHFDQITLIEEERLPYGLIEDGKIIDDLAFYEFFKGLVKIWDIKNINVRFYVPESLIIMREVEIGEEIPDEELKPHITMEIGNTIHFPFKNPVFDIYDAQTSGESGKRKITLLAAPEEEIIKYTEIFADASLHPIAVDVQALGVYRYYYKFAQEEKDISLLFEISLTSTNVSIFGNDRLHFLRYQQLDISTKDWEFNEKSQWVYNGEETHLHAQMEDQINELGQIMNFYRYSLHQGEKAINQVIILGDYPDLTPIAESIESRFDIRTTILDPQTDRLHEEIDIAFIPALGLALKEDV